LDIHGISLSAQNLGVLQTVSGIEADDALRVWEIWYDQKFYDDNGASHVDLKLGQQSLDQEFIVSSNAGYFVNTMFGWPMVPSADLPGGGPAYPLSALGARLRVKPAESISVLAGVFNGAPYSNPMSAAANGDSQIADPDGLQFPLNGGVMAIAEIQYSFPSLGDMTTSSTPPMSGTYRLGAWYNSENFADERFDDQGLSLADPNTDGNPANHVGNYSIYGVIDQMIWRSETDPNRTLSFFARGMWAPADRNLIDYSVNVGFVLKDPFIYRTDDVLGIGMGYAHVSPALAGLANDIALDNPGTPSPAPSGETFLEATYQYVVLPWFILQPDVQYIFNPQGLAIPTAPNTPGQSLPNELVIGSRAIVQL
jgi:porin